jgi:hypothetical protein
VAFASNTEVKEGQRIEPARFQARVFVQSQRLPKLFFAADHEVMVELSTHYLILTILHSTTDMESLRGLPTAMPRITLRDGYGRRSVF